MAGVIKQCVICGKLYEDCCPNRVPGTFRWQSVACCPEHAEEYLYNLTHPYSSRVTREAEQKPPANEPKYNKKAEEVTVFVDETEAGTEDG